MKKKGKGATTEEVSEEVSGEVPPPVAEGQEALFASIVRSSLMKARPGAMFVNAVIQELRTLMNAERSAAALENRDVDTDKIRVRLGEAMAYAVGSDPQMAESARAAKLTAEQVTGLIGALGQVKTEKGYTNLTDLIKAEQLGLFGGASRPPAGFEPIVGSKRGGYHKRHGLGFIYWYPDTGMISAPHPDDVRVAPKIEGIKPEAAKLEEKPKLIVTPEEVKESERRFETAGKKIGGSRADLAAMKMDDLEKNPTLARTLVTKANVFGTWKPDWAAMDREAGVTPAAAFAKKEILDSVSGKPFDHPDIRDHYRQGANILLSGLARCKTMDDIHDLLDEWQDAALGRKLGKERFREDGPFAFEWIGEGGMMHRTEMDFMNWLAAGNKGTLADHYKAWEKLQNSPSFRRETMARGGLAAWRRNRDGTISPLWISDKVETATSKLYVGAFGNRFAELVGHVVRMRSGSPAIGANTTWSGEVRTTKGRAEFDKKVGEIERATADEAWSWAVGKEKKAKSEKPTMGALDVGDSKWVWTRKTGKAERKGGPKVDPPKDSVEVMKAFGFPGVEYGNWANDAEREFHITGAHAGLIDLADVLGVEPTKLGIKDRLSVAFGSRGSGGFRAPTAHYEPGRQVINITKLHGAGSLAHEWGHFMDHALMMAYGKEGKPRMLSEGNPPREMPGDVSKAMAHVLTTIKYKEMTEGELKARAKRRIELSDQLDQLKAEVQRRQKNVRWEKRQKTKEEMAFDEASLNAPVEGSGKQVIADNPPPGGWKKEDVVPFTTDVVKDENWHAMVAARDKHNKLLEEWRNLSGRGDETEHYAAAQSLAGGNYYCSDRELFAYAFESWVEDKLHSQGRRNGYLVDGTREDAAGVFIPAGSEHRKAVGAAIEELIGTLRKHNHFEKSLRMVIGFGWSLVLR